MTLEARTGSNCHHEDQKDAEDPQEKADRLELIPTASGSPDPGFRGAGGTSMTPGGLDGRHRLLLLDIGSHVRRTTLSCRAAG